MKTIELDFSGRWSLIQRLGVVILSIGAVAATAVGARYTFVASELRALRLNEIEALPQPLAEISSAESPESHTRATDIANRLLEPWDIGIAAAENSVTPDVALLSMHSDQSAQTMGIVVEARDIPSMLQFQRALLGHRSVKSVRLLSYTQQEDAQAAIRFEMEFDWRLVANASAP